MSRLTIWKSTIAFVAMIFVVTPVRAQSKSRVEAAEEAIQTAIAFANEENFEAACPLLERAYVLDPSERVSFALADCRDRQGQIATALGLWRAFVRTFGNARENNNAKLANHLKMAELRIAALEAEVPKVKFACQSGNCEEIKLFVDGRQVRPLAVVELDPAEHQILIVRPGGGRQTQVLNATRGQPITAISVVGETSPAPQIGALNRGKSSPGDSANMDRTRQARRMWGATGIFVGSAAIVTGGILGIAALAQKSKIDEECLQRANGMSCTPVGVEAANEGRVLGNAATIPLVLGAALATTGVVLTVRNPRVTTTAAIGSTMDGMPFLSIQGRF